MRRQLVPPALHELYAQHVAERFKQYQHLMQRLGYERLLIASGDQCCAFRDDVNPPYRVNSYFKTWLPVLNRPNCYVLIDVNDTQPHLFFCMPEDIWHHIEPLTDAAIKDAFQVHVFACPHRLAKQLSITDKTALIDPHNNLNNAIQWPDVITINPEILLTALDFERAFKSPYEVACLRLANQRAARGHQMAEQVFQAGGSEFEIHMAYLSAVELCDHELPYGSIVALNQNGAVLHYDHKQRHKPSQHRSLLIDAGASVAGYGADITRTYAAAGEEEFAELVEAMEQLQQTLVREVYAGVDFVKLHLRMHELLAELLSEHQLVRSSPEAILEQELTRVFLPHGLGHLLGVQVHDRGGWLHNGQGQELLPPDQHPYLRLTRSLEAGMAFTIEPGLYFIDALLEPLLGELRGSLINWDKLELLRSCGGIRIEDDVYVGQDGVENLTREAFAGL